MAFTFSGCKKLGISQENLAYESELDRSYISMLERGLRMPTILTLFEISKALKTTPTKIIKTIEERYEAS